MSIILFGKLFVGGAATVGASVIAMWYTGVIGGYKNQSPHDQSAKELEVYVMKAEQHGSTDQTLTEGEFQCRFKKDSGAGDQEHDPFVCTMEKLTFSDLNDKKNFSYSDISSLPTTKTLTTEALKDRQNVFKITFSGQYEKKGQFAATQIEIVSKDEIPKIHATISEWFVVDKNTGTATFLGTTKYFIGKSGQKISDASADGKYKCSFTENGLSSITNENCTIHTFSTDTGSDLQSLKFLGNLSSSSTIEESKFYVVVFDKAEDIKMSKEQTQIFVQKKDTPASKSTFTNIHTSAFAKDKFLVLGENK